MSKDLRGIAATRRTVVPELTAQFLPLEASASETAGMAAAFVASLVDAHRVAAFPPTAAAQAIALAADAARLSLAARAKVMEAHDELRKLPSELRLEGSSPDCPPDFMGMEQELRAVA